MQAGDFSKLHLKEFARLQDRETSEARFWKTFSVVKEMKFPSGPNAIHFNPSNPREYLVTSSLKVHLFDGLTDKVQRAYSRFQDDAFDGRFRADGKLIAAGEKSGTVKVFDYQSKALLRQLRRHTGAVRNVSWMADGTKLLSAGDDKRVLKWDVGTEEVTWSSRHFHTDYVRAVEAHPFSTDLFATASYDHTVALWDSRTQTSDQPVWSVNHGAPVEKALFTPSGALLLTAGANEIKLWDVVQGGRLLHTFANHQKNVTSLALDGTSSRLLSSGLDGHVKVYSLQSLQVVHGMKYNSPILSLGLSSDHRRLVLGFTNGDLMIRCNKRDRADGVGIGSGGLTTAAPPQEVDPIADLLENGIRRPPRVLKGAAQILAEESAVVVESERTAHLQPYEKHLKKFNYQKALDTALATRNPVIIITVMDELCRRNGLTIALSGRDEVTLEPLMTYLARYITHARYSKFVIQILQRVLDLYGNVLGYSESIDELFMKVQRQAALELNFQKEILKILGGLECVTNVASMPPVSKKRSLEDVSVIEEDVQEKKK